MENFSYCSPTKYIFGNDAEQQTGTQVAALGCKHVLIVYGGGSVCRSGLLDRIIKSLDSANIKHTEFGGIQPNPTDTEVYRGIDVCRANGIDGILAVGGGSVIDAGKAMAAGAPYEGDFWDFWAGRAVIEKALPVGVVLTIAAAGSEGSGNSVITKTDGLQKISLRTDFALRPKFAIMNPELTTTLPPYQTACGITDMMAHIMERYFSPTPNVEITDRLCEGALMAIMTEAQKVIADPNDYQARANIMWSGTIAHNGICGTGRREAWSSHGLEHVLSALYGIAHGAGLAVVFPAWMTFMATHKPAKIAQYARRVFGVTESDDTKAALEGIRLHREFPKTIGMPLTLGDLDITNPDIDLFVAKFHQDKGQVTGSYYPIDSTVSRKIYELML
ncbi:MAG: iron-containing alcohol dehydrogenase [Muribaculaceae bacterium]|nr:iron-containing alcohol dehydrogenase [Muribaculaceae bacterium]